MDVCLDDLEYLASLLYSCNTTIHQTLIESLIINTLPDDLSDAEVEQQVLEMTDGANEALVKIRDFTKYVPLVPLVKIGRKDLDFFPHPGGGGESWFADLKSYWRDRLNRQYEYYVAHQGKERIEAEIRELTGEDSFSYISGYEIEYDNELIRGRYSISMGYIKVFMTNVFSRRINHVLKAILMEAEFYKRENRNQFTDAYTFLLKLPQEIQMIESSMMHGTPLFADLQKFLVQRIPEDLVQSRYYSLLADVDKRINRLISDSLLFCGTMEKVLEGILFGKSGRAYDSITNLGNIKGNNNKEFITSLTQVLQDFNGFLRLLFNIFDIEKKMH